MSRLRWNAGQIVQDNEDIGIEGVDYFKRSSAYYTEDFVKILYNEIKDYKSRIEKAVEYMKDFIFEPLLVQEDRKLIMYNENLRKFENILDGDNNE